MYKYNTLLQTRESRYQSSAAQASDVTQTNQSLPPPQSSHGSAVLNAALGRDARPRQKAAQEILCLPVNPLRNRAGAQTGQCRTYMMNIIKDSPWRMSAIDVEDVGEAILQHSSYRVIIW